MPTNARSASGNLLAAQSGALLYSQSGDILSYPQGQHVGTYWAGNRSEISIEGMCSDATGDVFVSADTGGSGSHVYEYAHGGKHPIATLTNNWEYTQCSVDPLTGNLAVVVDWPSYPANIAVYPSGRGTPEIYHDRRFWMSSCTYDSAGNLFIGGAGHKIGTFRLAELPNGSGSITDITLSGVPAGFLQLGHVQWDGKYLALTIYKGHSQHVIATDIYRVSVAGSTGTIVGITHLNSHGLKPLATWIAGDVVAANNAGAKRRIGLWHYPAGGQPFASFFGGSAHDIIGGLTISR